jgi:hypothetical protein
MRQELADFLDYCRIERRLVASTSGGFERTRMSCRGRRLVRAVEEWPYPFSALEDLADDAELDPDELRAYLRAEIGRRRRARYGMHAHAYTQLDALTASSFTV